MSSTRKLPAILCLIFLLTPLTLADELSPLAKAPDWTRIMEYYQIVKQSDFQSALHSIYATESSARPTIKIGEGFAEIKRRSANPEVFRFEFAPESGEAVPPPRYWRTVSELPPREPEQPLSGLKIAIDPGHLGGEWAQMEERYFVIGDKMPVKEGDLTLFVAQLLKPELEDLGAEVFLVRENSEPVTTRRPKDFTLEARSFLRKKNVENPIIKYPNHHDQLRLFSVDWQSEKLFYRTSEIIARARKINSKIKPDVCLCLHFNAEAWGDPALPDFVENNHMHILINGSYSLGELAHDDIRFGMLLRLLQGTHKEELALASSIAPTLAKSTKLPAYTYPGDNARRINDDPYIWARNLLANRLYECPVIYFEPFVMNNADVHQRILTGDYIGRTLIGDELRSSIYRDYIDGIVKGLVNYYTTNREEADPEASESPETQEP